MSIRISVAFDAEKQGILTGRKGSTQVGGQAGALAPYDMILGGLGSCLHYTFQTVIDKKRIAIESVHYSIEGNKRDEVPATLKDVYVKATVSGAKEEDKRKIEKAFDIATRQCSVYQTLEKVADMHPELVFNS